MDGCGLPLAEIQDELGVYLIPERRVEPENKLLRITDSMPLEWRPALHL